MLLNAAMVETPAPKAIHAMALGAPAPAQSAAQTHAALIRRIANARDKSAFVELFDYFAPRVKSFLMKGGTNETLADELAQETMLAVWEKAASFNPAKSAPSTWIYTIARNKKIDHLRKGVRYDLDIDDMDHEDSAPNAADQIIAADETKAIAEAIKTLPAEQADLIRRAFFDGKSHSEIADDTKLPLGTVKSRMRLALDRLRKNETVKSLWQ